MIEFSVSTVPLQLSMGSIEEAAKTTEGWRDRDDNDDDNDSTDDTKGYEETEDRKSSPTTHSLKITTASLLGEDKEPFVLVVVDVFSFSSSSSSTITKEGIKLRTSEFTSSSLS